MYFQNHKQINGYYESQPVIWKKRTVCENLYNKGTRSSLGIRKWYKLKRYINTYVMEVIVAFKWISNVTQNAT